MLQQHFTSHKRHRDSTLALVVFFFFFFNSFFSGKGCRLKIKKGCLTFLAYLLAATAKSLQSCPTLCDPIDGSPPGSPIPGILQARTLEWVAISFSNA